MVFNLYICYDSTTEMQDILNDMKNEYTEEKWEQGMYGGYSVKPDILVRTSNEVWLSNFLLYQSKDSMISYVANYWPDFSVWDFIKIMIEYQNFTGRS